MMTEKRHFPAIFSFIAYRIIRAVDLRWCKPMRWISVGLCLVKGVSRLSTYSKPPGVLVRPLL